MFFQTLTSYQLSTLTRLFLFLVVECRRVFLPRRMHGPVGRDTGTNSTVVGNYSALPGTNELNSSKNYRENKTHPN